MQIIARTSTIQGGPETKCFEPYYQPFSTIPLQNPRCLPRGTCRKESYLYGGVIFIHKVVLDELDGECTLTHASSSHHHQLILRHVCR